MTRASAITPTVELAGVAPQPKPLSPSQVETWLECPARWYYRYVLELPDPPTAALALGHAIHTATAACLRGLGHTGKLPDLSEYEDILIDALDRELAEVEPEPGETHDAIRDKARVMLTIWHRDAAPSIAPVAVERQVAGEIGGVPVRGRVDVITMQALIIDLKTASRKPSAITAPQQLQLTTYAMLSFPRAAEVECEIHTLTKTASPAFVCQRFTVDAPARRYAETLYQLAQEGMRDGLYTPHRNSLMCTRQSCAYWRECEAEYGGQVRSTVRATKRAIAAGVAQPAAELLADPFEGF